MAKRVRSSSGKSLADALPCPASSGRPFTEPWKSSNLVLVVEGRKFHVHREMLIVCSPVFEAMLTSNFKEKYVPEIPLPGKKADDIKELLKAIYPDRDYKITKQNCFTLLKLSTEYQISRLKTHCENFVIAWASKDMTQDEALEFVVLSQNYALKDETVQRCMKRFITDQRHSWVELKKHELFSQLEPANVQRITDQRVKYLEKPYTKLNIKRPPPVECSSESSSDSSDNDNKLEKFRA